MADIRPTATDTGRGGIEYYDNDTHTRAMSTTHFFVSSHVNRVQFLYDEMHVPRPDKMLWHWIPAATAQQQPWKRLRYFVYDKVTQRIRATENVQMHGAHGAQKRAEESTVMGLWLLSFVTDKLSSVTRKRIRFVRSSYPNRFISLASDTFIRSPPVPARFSQTRCAVSFFSILLMSVGGFRFAVEPAIDSFNSNFTYRVWISIFCNEAVVVACVRWAAVSTEKYWKLKIATTQTTEATEKTNGTESECCEKRANGKKIKLKSTEYENHAQGLAIDHRWVSSGCYTNQPTTLTAEKKSTFLLIRLNGCAIRFRSHLCIVHRLTLDKDKDEDIRIWKSNSFVHCLFPFHFIFLCFPLQFGSIKWIGVKAFRRMG